MRLFVAAGTRGAAIGLIGVLLCGFVSGKMTWEPGKDPDPQEILNQAENDARAGRYADALAKHVWFHENVLKFDPAMYGVRLSFALSSWKALADSYPPALEKLKAERDEAGANVRAGRVPHQSFHDFAALNHVLGEDGKTRDLFVWLDGNNPKAATEVFDLAQPALVRAREYGICGKYLDPDRSFRRMLLLREETKNVSTGGADDRGLRAFADQSFTNSVTTLIALLVVNERRADADRIADQARNAWDEPAFRDQIEKALKGEVPPPWP